MRWIVGIFVLLMIKPILYLLKGLWFIAELFFMVPLCQNFTRNHEMDPQLGVVKIRYKKVWE